jgi:hypothetical protein
MVRDSGSHPGFLVCLTPLVSVKHYPSDILHLIDATFNPGIPLKDFCCMVALCPCAVLTLPLLFQHMPTDFRQTLPVPMDPVDSPMDFHRSPLESIGND